MISTMKLGGIALVALIVGLLGGYYIGFGHGFEGALRQHASFGGLETAAGDAAETMRLLIGTWRSTQDEKFTRTFHNDGVVIDAYEGSSPESEGLWLVFTKDIPDASYTGPVEAGSVYLSMAMSESERLYFKVTRIDNEKLELVFLDRGGVLSFDRVN